MWTQYSMYQYTNEVVSVLCWRLQCMGTLHTLTIKKKSYLPILNLSNTDFYFTLTSLPSGSSHSGLLRKFCTPFFYTIYMLHATYVSSLLWLCYSYLVKSNSQEAHYRIFYIPLFVPHSHTKYSPNHTALTNPQYVFFSWIKTPNFTPTQETGTMSVL